MCTSFKLDPQAERNSFYDRLAGDALTHLLDYRTSDHPMQFRINFLRLRFAIIKPIEEVTRDYKNFARVPNESLNVCITRLERICTDYMAVSKECSLECKNMMVWNIFITLVPHPRLAEKFESLDFKSDNLQEAVRLAQQHYNRYNLAPWGKNHLDKEKREAKSSSVITRKSNAITANTDKKNKNGCFGCGGPHRIADCLVSGGDMKAIKGNKASTAPQANRNQSGSTTSGSSTAQRAGAENTRRKTCYWCTSSEHPSRECPIAQKVQKWVARKRQQGNRPTQGNHNGRNNTRRVNNVTAEGEQESEYGLTPTGEERDNPGDNQENS